MTVLTLGESIRAFISRGSTLYLLSPIPHNYISLLISYGNSQTFCALTLVAELQGHLVCKVLLQQSTKAPFWKTWPTV